MPETLLNAWNLSDLDLQSGEDIGVGVSGGEGIVASDVQDVTTGVETILPENIGAGQILNGWVFRPGYMYSGVGTNTAGMSPIDYPFWAGATYDNRTTAPFRVTIAGVLYATGAFISGAITASTIDIGGSDATSFHVDIDGNMWLGGATLGTSISSITNAGLLTTTSANIGGWIVVSGYIYNLQSGTPTSSPNDGVVLASGNEALIVYEDTAKRAEIGYLAAGIYGMKAYATDGTTVIFEASDTQQMLGGWNFTNTVLRTGSTDANSNVLIDSANSLMRLGPTTGNYLSLDGANLRVRTSTFSAGLQGWSIESDGSAEFANITARGEFHTQVLSYGEVHATAGTAGVFKSAGKLKNDFTSVTSPTTFNVDIDDPDTGHVQVFAVSDILRIKDGSGNDNWMTISSVSDQTTFFRYVCTKNSGTNGTFRAGAAIVDYGPSGQGFLYMTADGTNAPFYSVRTHAGSPWSTMTEKVRLGNLNGFLDYASDLYGIGIGETTKFLKYDSTNGLRVAGNLNNQIERTAGETITVGQWVVIKTHTTRWGNASTMSIPNDDARVDQANPDTNYSAITTATVGADAGGNANWFFMKWDLSSTVFPTIASKCFIRLKWTTNANLAGVATNHRINVYKVTGADWVEGTITWNNKPAVNGTAEDSWSISPNDDIEITESIFGQGTASGRWIFLDITTLYNAWKAGSQSNYGIAIRLEKAAGGETTDVRITDLLTAENGSTLGRPTLLLTGVLPSNIGRAYKADDDLIDLIQEEIGVAITGGNAGDTITIQTSGIVSNQSSLTTGATYFVSSTAGGITTDRKQREVGVALSATEILLNIKPTRPLSFYLKYTYGGLTTAGADVSVVNKIPIFLGFNPSNYRFTAASSNAGTTIMGFGEQFGTGGDAYNLVNSVFGATGDTILAATGNTVQLGSQATPMDFMDFLRFQFDTDNTNNNVVEGWLTATP